MTTYNPFLAIPESSLVIPEPFLVIPEPFLVLPKPCLVIPPLQSAARQRPASCQSSAIDELERMAEERVHAAGFPRAKTDWEGALLCLSVCRACSLRVAWLLCFRRLAKKPALCARSSLATAELSCRFTKYLTHRPELGVTFCVFFVYVNGLLHIT